MIVGVGAVALVGVAGVGVAATSAAAVGGAVAYRRYKRNKKRKELLKKNASVLFGEPLSDLHPKYIAPNGIPQCIELTCSILEKNALEVEGLFRVPGSTQKIKFFESTFETGKEEEINSVNWEGESLHDIGGVFKLYFRKLPEGLCTFALFDQFIEIEREEENDDEKWKERMKVLIYQLPDPNLRLMLRIIPFFHLVSKHANVNLMSCDNLSIVFGGVIFSNDDRSPAAMLEQSAVVGRLMSKLIEFAPEVLYQSLNDLPYVPKSLPEQIVPPTEEKKKSKRRMFKKKSKSKLDPSEFVISSPTMISTTNQKAITSPHDSHQLVDEYDSEDDDDFDSTFNNIEDDIDDEEVFYNDANFYLPPVIEREQSLTHDYYDNISNNTNNSVTPPLIPPKPFPNARKSLPPVPKSALPAPPNRPTSVSLPSNPEEIPNAIPVPSTPPPNPIARVRAVPPPSFRAKSFTSTADTNINNNNIDHNDPVIEHNHEEVVESHTPSNDINHEVVEYQEEHAVEDETYNEVEVPKEQPHPVIEVAPQPQPPQKPIVAGGPPNRPPPRRPHVYIINN